MESNPTESAPTSPVKTQTPTPTKTLMTFPEAIKEIIKGKRISKVDWNDTAYFGVLKDDRLKLHKPNEADDILHDWILSTGDLTGEDFFTL